MLGLYLLLSRTLGLSPRKALLICMTLFKIEKRCPALSRIKIISLVLFSKLSGLKTNSWKGEGITTKNEERAPLTLQVDFFAGPKKWAARNLHEDYVTILGIC